MFLANSFRESSLNLVRTCALTAISSRATSSSLASRKNLFSLSFFTKIFGQPLREIDGPPLSLRYPWSERLCHGCLLQVQRFPEPLIVDPTLGRASC